ITIFNKMDLVGESAILRDFHAEATVRVSAGTGEGLQELKQLLRESLKQRRRYLERLFSYADAGLIQQIRQRGELVSEEYTEDGILVKAYVPAELFGRFAEKQAEE
ncbi:MAG: GTPase HflX, partial [Lachnospiraceae bacterium]